MRGLLLRSACTLWVLLTAAALQIILVQNARGESLTAAAQEGTYQGVPIFNNFKFQGAQPPRCSSTNLPDLFPFQAGTGARRVIVNSPTSFIAAQNVGNLFNEVGVLFLNGNIPLGAVCSGSLAPGSEFVTTPSQRPTVTTRAIIYSFRLSGESCNSLLSLSTESDFTTFDTGYQAADPALRAPIGVVAQTAGAFSSNGTNSPNTLIGLPLVARSLSGKGLSSVITLHRSGVGASLPIALLYYDYAGLHDFLCAEVQPRARISPST